MNMNSISDVYKRLKTNPSDNTKYDYTDNSIVFINDTYNLKAYNQKKNIIVDLSFDGQNFSFIAPDYENLYSLFSDINAGKITIDRLSEISIIIKGYARNKTSKFSKIKAVLCSVIGIICSLFGLIMTLFIPFASIKEKDYTLFGTLPIYIAFLLIGIAFIRYGIKQHKYKRRIIPEIFGYAITGFSSAIIAVGLIDDYGKYTTDTIGGCAVLVLFMIIGLFIIIASKKAPEEDKNMFLTRVPLLPDTEQADKIFCYMDELCMYGKVDFDEISSTGRNADIELNLFMRYCADKLSIQIDDTLQFDELLGALSEYVTRRFDDSNVAKYYYYDDEEEYD